MNNTEKKRSPYLTKSRFKLALECPSKLHYTAKDQYPDSKVNNEFLRALAEGGYQVGELAKLYYPGGTEIEGLNALVAVEQTNNLLKDQNATIYEAAFLVDNLFIRSDIVVKKGNTLQLIEVKAKSVKGSTEDFIGAKGKMLSKWRPYLYDVAFQMYVIQRCYPNLNVEPYLLFADKTAVATVDGLNQKFLIHKDGGRTKVRVSTDILLGNQLLIQRNVQSECDMILQNLDTTEYGSFEERVQHYVELYTQDRLGTNGIHENCGKCEFVATSEQRASGKLSGFHQCMSHFAGITDKQLEQPTIFKLWDNRRKAEQIANGKFFLSDLEQADIEPKTQKKSLAVPYLTRLDRQLLQIEKIRKSDKIPFLDIDGLRTEFSTFKYPLNFIDFETTAVAIPFNKGMHPYEQTAFQFSHHILENDGTIIHASQWINTDVGVFPNFEFVRALKDALSKNEGTIFRYAAHENTILNKLYEQINISNEADKVELGKWIQTITKSTSSTAQEWNGPRNMVDMLDLVKKYYYHPHMEGSNSIKAVLPAVISSSEYLKRKYSAPLYGSTIVSLNFKDHTWIKFDTDGNTISPYKQLTPIHEGYSNEEFDELLMDEEAGIYDGGAAMIAYAKMQFTEMTNTERKLVTDSLLRYCELDTLSMAMIYEAWKEEINR